MIGKRGTDDEGLWLLSGLSLWLDTVLLWTAVGCNVRVFVMPLLGMYNEEGTALILFANWAEQAQRDGSLVIHLSLIHI